MVKKRQNFIFTENIGYAITLLMRDTVYTVVKYL